MILDKESQIHIELIGESTKQPKQMRQKLLASSVVALATVFIAFQTLGNGQSDQVLQNPTNLALKEINLGEWKKLNSFGLLSGPIKSVHVSPKGDIYVLQDQQFPSYQRSANFRRYSFKYDSFEGSLQKFAPALDAKINAAGEYFLLLENGELRKYKTASDWEPQSLSGISEFGLSKSGKLHLVFNDASKVGSSNAFVNSEIGQYKAYRQNQATSIEVDGEDPILVLNDRLVGLDKSCVSQVTAGYDGSIWALSCDAYNGASQDKNLLKWDKKSTQWSKVNGAFGSKVAALNEKSVVLVREDNSVFIMKNGFTQTAAKPVTSLIKTGMFSGSGILSDASLIKFGLEEEHFTQTRLCYRASQDGFNGDLFVNQCRDKGPSVTIVKTKKGKIFGGYNPLSWSQVAADEPTPNAFIFFQNRNLIVHPKKPNQCAVENTNAGPKFGPDLFVDLSYPNSQASRFGFIFDGINYLSVDATKFLADEVDYQLADVEIYLLS
ncbi:UNKNOWN [Stylonychia lemnae]|uniref:TLDc domain-containing protein n=1 Tax=Stylonychia lemnae TaxID=5949 RepID=A0A078AB50_STYLE|nr:UNKNOWN [Stylonychia lemnae]|eukprot:CDW79106.1 UNKNOWN [Stylonychia lemnae]